MVVYKYLGIHEEEIEAEELIIVYLLAAAEDKRRSSASGRQHRVQSEAQVT